MKNVPVQVSSAVAAVIGFITVLHPGFHVSASTQQIVVVGVIALITVLQSLHLHVSAKVAQILSNERSAYNALTVKTPSVASAQSVVTSVGSLMSDVVLSDPTTPPTTSTNPDLHL
jgi:hypothetical protein